MPVTYFVTALTRNCTPLRDIRIGRGLLGALLLPALLQSGTALASDHIDGPVTTQHKVADLTDLYAFPTPGKAGSLTIILNTYPIVPHWSHFSDKVNYKLTLRSASIKDSGLNFSTGDEVSITCSFKTPDDTALHTVKCVSSNGLIAERGVGEVKKDKLGDDFSLFAGMRADPFFFFADFASKAAKEGLLLPPQDNNVMTNVNALSIAIDVDMNKLFKTNTPSMVGITAESLTYDSPDAPARRLDRVGRPEITNVSLVDHDGVELRDQYNLDQPFEVSLENMKTYARRLFENITHYDKIDGKTDWQEPSSKELATILANDFLVVDISKPCQGNDFFEIEKSMLLKKSYETCGGRKLKDDIMDTYFTLYIAGLSGERIRDGVDQPSIAISDEFPYLPEPNLSLSAKLKQKAARLALGLTTIWEELF